MEIREIDRSEVKDFIARVGRALDHALKQHGIARDIKIYPDARHSFFNEDGGSYDKAAGLSKKTA